MNECLLSNRPSYSVLRLESSTVEKIGRDPMEVVNYFVTKDVRVGELFASFEKIKFDYGCFLLGKPVTDITIVQPLRKELGLVKNGHRFELTCLAEGFPTPTYEYFKDGQRISSGPRYEKISAKYSDSGLYECRITQRRFTEPTRQVSQFCTVRIERGKFFRPSRLISWLQY